ncbi:hypothetical protein ACFWVM_01120 [Nocardia fluminea]|uniref:hypothetical protein n=1 Tax=Nocardia fluminea TaxID=134984 RepID=UPI00365D8D10
MPAGKQRRFKRDPELGRRLDEVHNLMKVRRSEAERRETATMDAVQTYLQASGSIRQRTVVRDQRVSELRKRIEELEREYEAEVTRWRGQQAGAVTVMRELGESDTSIGELLELTSKQVRQLVASARAAEQPRIDPDGQDLGGVPDVALYDGGAVGQPSSRAAFNVDTPKGQSLA